MAMIPRLDLALPGGPVMSTTEAGTAPMAALWPLVAHRIDGVLGYDVLRRYVVKLDYRRRRLLLYDPATYRYDGPGMSLPFTLGETTTPRSRVSSSFPAGRRFRCATRSTPAPARGSGLPPSAR